MGLALIPGTAVLPICTMRVQRPIGKEGRNRISSSMKRAGHL